MINLTHFKYDYTCKDTVFITWFKSNILCPSLVTLANLFVKTKAYPNIPPGMFSENLNSTLTD